MGEPSFLEKMVSRLRETCKYHTGYPKGLGPSKVINFTSEREFIDLLHQGHPVIVAFTIRGNLTMLLDQVLKEAAAEFSPHVKFVRVECPKYPGFCIARQKTQYPFIELFHTPELTPSPGQEVDTSITKYSVKVIPYNYDTSVYGFREFFKHYKINVSDPK